MFKLATIRLNLVSGKVVSGTSLEDLNKNIIHKYMYCIECKVE